GSMGSIINTVKNSVAQLATELEDQFRTVRYSLITFKDSFEELSVEDSYATGTLFTTFEHFQTELNTLTASGGGPAPENGFGAITLVDALNWRPQFSVSRAIVLMTDAIPN